MPGLNVERAVFRALNHGDEGYELLEQAAAVRLLPASGPASWLADRVRFLGSAAWTCLRYGLSAAASPELEQSTVVYDPANGNERVRAARSFFLAHHFGHEAAFLGSGIRRRGGAKRGRWWSWYWRGVGWALLAWVDWSERRYTWMGPLLVDVQLYARDLPSIERVFVFGLYHRRAYLLGTWLAKRTDRETVFVFQNIPLARNCRYLHLRIPVVVTSRVNLAEVAYYAERHEFLARDVVYAGQEWALDTHGLERTEPVYDIGFYSSGEWARREGLYQYDDVEQIRRREFEGNAYDVVSRELLETLAAYARERGRTVRIYPHPLERRLLVEHGIAPPYAHLADGEHVTFDDSAGDSRSSMYTCRVAVSLQSSFIWERLDLGLDDSFIYEFEDGGMNVFAREALGDYARNVFSTPAEMIEKVDLALSGESNAD